MTVNGTPSEIAQDVYENRYQYTLSGRSDVPYPFFKQVVWSVYIDRNTFIGESRKF